MHVRSSSSNLEDDISQRTTYSDRRQICLCRHQSKRAAAADSDNMDPELRVVMLGGQENDGGAGVSSDALQSVRSSLDPDNHGLKKLQM